MKSRKIIKSLILVILVVGFVVMAFMSTQKMLNEKTVYIFSHDMNGNIEITKDDIKEDLVTAKDLKDNMITDPERIIGKYTSSKVYEEHYVYDVSLIDASEIDPFAHFDFTLYEKIPIDLDYVTGVGGDFKPGDKINLYFINEGVTKDGQNDEFVYSKRFMVGIPIYKILTENGFKFVPHANFSTAELTESEELTGESISTSTNDEDLGLFVVLMTAEQAEEYYSREFAGTIRIAGTFDDPFETETDGYVVGRFDEVYSGATEVETDRSTSNGIESDIFKDEEDEEDDLPSLGEIINPEDEDEASTDDDSPEE